MNTFTNGFHIAKRNDNSEVVIYFMQSSPGFPPSDPGNPNIDHVEIVGSFVMRPELAVELSQKLSQLLLPPGDPTQETLE